MKNFFLLSNNLKKILFTVPTPSLPIRYCEILREIKKAPFKLRNKFYYLFVYVWNVQQKITVTDTYCYSSLEDPLGRTLMFKGEEGSLFQLDTKKQVQLTIESLYRPTTWAQITTSIPFRMAIGGGLFFIYFQKNSTQNINSLNFLSQVNTKSLSSSYSHKLNKANDSNLNWNVYGNDWLVIEGYSKNILEDSPCFSFGSKYPKSIYFRKITSLLEKSSQKKNQSLANQTLVYLPVDLGFQNNRTAYYFRHFNLCNLEPLSKGSTKQLGLFSQNHNQLIQKNSLFYNEFSETPFLSFQKFEKFFLYGIFPYLMTRIWLAPSFVLWWSYKLDAEKKKNIKKHIKKIQQIQFIQIKQFLDKTVTFRDIGGMESLKKELKTAAFLLKKKNSFSPYPTGYIFAGPPGTGKTLMAKAMAYEAQTPYLYVEGYQFQDPETEIANARVDDLFNQIRELSPCILYIDEIDSIGERRDNNLEKGKLGNSSENEENKAKPSDTVLMQFLLRMDGFKAKQDVIIIGATNRLEILDDALLRPGRFDRQILFSPPLFKERMDILKIFLGKSKISEQGSIHELAQRSMGFNGCDLRLLADNLLFLTVYGKNQQAGVKEMMPKILEIDQAFERISRVRYKTTHDEITFKKKDFYRTACHEIGKAIIHILLPQALPIYSILLFPKPMNDRFLEIETKNIRVPSIDLISTNNSEYLLQKIVTLLAGRAAECALFNENLDDISTYLNRSFDPDLYMAYQTSRYMTELGLFDSTNGILQNLEKSTEVEQKQLLLFAQIHRFIKEKAFLKGTRQLRKTVKFEIQKPFLGEFWYEQNYIWEFDFIQQNKIKEQDESPLMSEIDIQTIYNLHTLFQYTYDFFQSNIELLDSLTFLFLKEKQLSYSKIIDKLKDSNIEIPTKTWKAW